MRLASRILVALLILLLSSSIAPLSRGQKEGAVRVLNPIKDTYIDESRPDLNFGASSELKVEGAAKSLITFLVFDLSKVPEGVDVVSADLILFLKSKSSDATSRIGVHRLLDVNWDELRVNALTMPKYVDTPTYLNDTVAFAGTWQAWDVTPDVKSAAAQGSVLLGWAVVSDSVSGIAVFSSSKSAQAPKLEIHLAVSDVTAPEFLSITLGPVPAGSGVAEVQVRGVDDLSGISNAVLSYSFDNSTWTDIIMQLDGDFYVGMLPERPVNSTLWYSVSLTDGAGNLAKSLAFPFVVGLPLTYQGLLLSYGLLLANYENLLEKFRQLSTNYSSASARLKEAEVGLASLSRLYSAAQTQLNSADLTSSTFEKQYRELQEAYAELNSAYQALQANSARIADQNAQAQRLVRLVLIGALPVGAAIIAFGLSLRFYSKRALKSVRPS